MAEQKGADKGVPTLITELWELIVTYFKQETIYPLKSLGKFIALGLGGSVLLAVGFLLLAMAGLRALQQETAPHWQGNWSWVPYLITVAGSVVVIALLAWRIGADRRRARKSEVTAARKGV